MKLSLPPLQDEFASRRGLSLLELLVVVGIIVVLCVLAFPMASRLLEASHVPKCQSNLRQIVLALQGYAFDHENYLPAAASNQDSQGRTINHRWSRQLGEVGDYLPVRRVAGSANRENLAFICPAASYGGVRGDALVRTYVATAVLRGPDNLGQLGRNRRAARLLTTVANPFSAPLVFEGKEVDPGASHIDIDYPGIEPDLKPQDVSRMQVLDFRHGGRQNVAMADGSIRVFTIRDFQTLTESDWLGVE